MSKMKISTNREKLHPTSPPTEVLKLKNTRTKLKKSLEKVNIRLEQIEGKKSINLKSGHLKLWSLMSKKEKKTNERKWVEPRRLKRYHQVDQYMYYRSFKKKRERERNRGYFFKIIIENIPEMKKILDIQIQEEI